MTAEIDPTLLPQLHMGHRARERHTERIRLATAKVSELGELSLRFASTERAPVRTDGRRENDAEHSYMLAIIAPYLAHEYYPKLDESLVALFSLIHDLPEVIVGDTPSFILTDEQREAKEAAEAAAVEELLQILPEPWNSLLVRYEQQEEPEARLVRLVDKIMPAILQVHGDGRATFRQTYGIETRAEVEEPRIKNDQKLREKYPGFPEIHDVKRLFWETSLDDMFPVGS